MNNNKLNKLIESIDQYIIENNDDKIDKLYKSLNNEEYDDLPVLKDAITIAYNILLGDSLNFSLRTDFMKKLFLLQDLKEGDFESNPQEYFDKVDNNIKSLTETPLNQLAVLVSGISFLNLYVQINWTGPTLEISKEFTFPNDNKEIRKLLEVDGEYIYSKCKNPIFLYLAKICLVDNYSFLSDNCKSACWWSCRAIMTHQKSLFNPTPTFKTLLNERFQIVVRFYSIDSLLNSNEDEMDTSDNSGDNEKSKKDKINLLKDLATRAIIEQSLVFSYYRQLNKIKDSVEKACEASELECSLTGALGRRTRFQTFDTAQLVIQINNARKRDEDVEDTVFDRNTSIKREVTNDDPTLLVRPALKEQVEGQNKNLRNIDQALILLQCLNVKNQNINNGLTTEEMMPYIQKTLEKSNNWLIHSMGLLIKSRLEIVSSKTAERAVLQIQALVDQYDDPTSSGFERMKFVYSLDYPTRWEIEKEVAERFIGIGAAASAFEIFERLEMWEEAIKCLTFMGKNARSEELVRMRLAIEETPELYCVLGDLKGDPEYYIKGWELSKKRYSRAQRALARCYMEKLEYQKCIESFTIALSINPLFPNAWFTMGCAAMRIENWETAINAFSRVVSLEPEEGEAWANLASVYMYLKQMDRAFNALQEGLKHKRESWKMWENYLHCCVAIKDYQNAIIALNQIFDLNNKKIDLKICTLVVNHVINNDIDRQGIPGRKIEKIVSEMFGRITSKLTNNPDLWRIYSQYHYSLGNTDKAIDLLQKACRSVETASWEGQQPTFEKVVEFNNNLCNLYFENPTTSNIYSAKLKIKGLIKKCEVSWKHTDSFKTLEQLLIKLEEKELELKK
ncbi:hypothetical protein DICPUDRAFT_82233 [Dictyostelium purpureum]|uniref:Uncharacterized protein n=1 Tax=Dictyostelium purpureum TaxID=5786 RepID=F0ZVX2_DICPU|nr:uncharacterized protein DICPUDRAFT_82233 [Dictyostelium purpureum]EGC31895.1 hypothetical protein DICPUDRAFT_82233 [Dictyostelium purpureum]|eukprot:XP_003291565.1 hypothetical protein DICPUDRAFT_82233 [Dictyostelium purpureum]